MDHLWSPACQGCSQSGAVDECQLLNLLGDLRHSGGDADCLTLTSGPFKET